MKIYLDTSVYGGYYDKGMEASIDLIDAINEIGITVLYSEVVEYEINKTKNLSHRAKIEKVLQSIKDKKELELTKKAETLAYRYIALGVLTRKSIEDAQHIALAVLNRVDYIVSWNFKHMVDRGQQYEDVSNLLKLEQVPIFSPDKFLTQVLKWKRKEKNKFKDH